MACNPNCIPNILLSLGTGDYYTNRTFDPPADPDMVGRAQALGPKVTGVPRLHTKGITVNSGGILSMYGVRYVGIPVQTRSGDDQRLPVNTHPTKQWML